jgi:hypothetical protein
MTTLERLTAAPREPAFPVTWDDPADELSFWTHNPQFYPDPVTPMTWSVLAAIFSGWDRAMAGYGLPFRAIIRRINTYLYGLAGSSVPATEPAAEEPDAEEKVQAAITRLRELWRDDLLPEIRAHLAYWETFDLRAPRCRPSWRTWTRQWPGESAW